MGHVFEERGSPSPAVADTEVAIQLGELAVGKSRDKVVTFPEFAILAVYKLPRLLDSLFLVRAFEALYRCKVSIIPKSVNSVLMHGLHPTSFNAERGIRCQRHHLSRQFFMGLQEPWTKRAFKPHRGVGPIAGQTQELPALLFGPSPGGPPKTIPRVRVIFIDRGHAHPSDGSTTGLSAIDAEGAEPCAMVTHHAPPAHK
jgi:hypothetical protein